MPPWGHQRSADGGVLGMWDTWSGRGHHSGTVPGGATSPPNSGVAEDVERIIVLEGDPFEYRLVCMTLSQNVTRIGHESESSAGEIHGVPQVLSAQPPLGWQPSQDTQIHPKKYRDLPSARSLDTLSCCTPDVLAVCHSTCCYLQTLAPKSPCTSRCNVGKGHALTTALMSSESKYDSMHSLISLSVTHLEKERGAGRRFMLYLPWISCLHANSAEVVGRVPGVQGMKGQR